MYLHATQLKNENDGLKSIMLREAALLATINCLNLAEVRFFVRLEVGPKIAVYVIKLIFLENIL